VISAIILRSFLSEVQHPWVSDAMMCLVSSFFFFDHRQWGHFATVQCWLVQIEFVLLFFCTDSVIVPCHPELARLPADFGKTYSIFFLLH